MHQADKPCVFALRVDRMSGSSPLPSSSPLTYNKLEPPLAVEVWGLLKALVTQLHVNMEPQGQVVV